MPKKIEVTNSAINDGEYIADQVRHGLLNELGACSVADVQEDYDGLTCHVVLHVTTNHCHALMESIVRLAELGLTISSMHQLQGQYAGDLEIDVIVNPKPKRTPTSPFFSYVKARIDHLEYVPFDDQDTGF